MDPLSVTLAVDEVLQSVATATRAGQAIVRTNLTKLQIFTKQLDAQKRRTAAWADKVRVLNNRTLATIVSSSDWQNVERIQALLEKDSRNAEAFIREWYSSTNADVSIKPMDQPILANAGYVRLEEIVQDLKALNLVLYDIAPTRPPSYGQDTPNTPRPSFLGQDSQHESQKRLAAHTRLAARLAASGNDTEPVMRVLNQTSFSATDQTSTDESQVAATTGMEDASLSLKTLFQSSLKPLGLLAVTKDEAYLHIKQRLTVWSTGLFEGVYSLDTLDTILDDELLKDVLSQAFVKILVYEEHELLMLSEATSNHGTATNALQSVLGNLTALLESGPIELVHEYTAAIFDAEADSSKAFSSLDVIGETVEDLFDILPTLAVAQRSACLSIEKTQKKTGALISEVPNNPLIPDTVSAATSINRDLESIGRAVKNWQSPDSEANGTPFDTDYAATFKKVLAHRRKFANELRAERSESVDAELKKMTSSLLANNELLERITELEKPQMGADAVSLRKRDSSPRIPQTKQNEAKVRDLVQNMVATQQPERTGDRDEERLLATGDDDVAVAINRWLKNVHE